MSFIDALRKDIIELTHTRDEKIKEGFKEGDIIDIAEGIGLSLLPLDLAKVAVGGAEKPADYLWAGLDAITILPFLRVGKLAKVAETAGSAGSKVGTILKYGILGGAGAGIAYALSNQNQTKNSNSNYSNFNIRKKARDGFIKWYHNDVITLDVTDKVKQVYPDVKFARLTIYANDINKIIPVAVYDHQPPPRNIKDIVKGWEQGLELERMKIGDKYYYIAFPCHLEMERDKKTIWVLFIILIIIMAIGYYIYKRR